MCDIDITGFTESLAFLSSLRLHSPKKTETKIKCKGEIPQTHTHKKNIKTEKKVLFQCQKNHQKEKKTENPIFISLNYFRQSYTMTY